MLITLGEAKAEANGGREGGREGGVASPVRPSSPRPFSFSPPPPSLPPPSPLLDEEIRKELSLLLLSVSHYQSREGGREGGRGWAIPEVVVRLRPPVGGQ